AVPMPIDLAPAADLRVTSLAAPEHAIVGQTVDLSYTVTNVGAGATPANQPSWQDLIYLSRDEFLDLNADRFLDFVPHTGPLASGASYAVAHTIKLPRGLTGPF